MKSTGLFGAVALLFCSAAPSFSCACGSTTPAAEADGGVAADGGRRDGGFLDLDAGPRADGGDSGSAPDGWASLDFPECPIEYATRPETVVGLTWTACPASLNLPAGACRRIAFDTPGLDASSGMFRPTGASEDGGGVFLALRRKYMNSLEFVASQLDGPVLGAVRTKQRNGCAPFSGGALANRFVVSVLDASQTKSVVVRGISGKPVEVVARYNTPRTLIPIKQGIGVYGGGLRLLDWETSAETTLVPGSSPAFTDLADLQDVHPRLYGLAGKPRYQIYEYSSGTPKLIVAAGRDVGEVGSYAASAERMFWSNITLDADRQAYSEDALYTQTLAADGTLSGTRQRLPSPPRRRYVPGGARFGCNVVARLYLDPRPLGAPTGTGTGGLEVFNFTTLKHWVIPTPTDSADPASFIGIDTINAVTCTEIIASINHFDPVSPQMQQNFARFDLSKLGPGEPFAMTPDPVP